MATTRKQRASRHASRPWTCVCGRTVFGNGGKTSHQRACRDWKQSRVEVSERILADIEAGGYGNLNKATVAVLKERHEFDLEKFKAELAG